MGRRRGQRAGIEAEWLADLNVISARHLDRLLGGELLATGPRLDWANLLRRTFDIDIHRCPRCGARMRPIAELTDRVVIERILDCLAMKAHARSSGEAPHQSRAPPSSTSFH